MEDSRCCGTGTCIINEDGQCWCGQRWDGERMCFPQAEPSPRSPSTVTLEQQPDEASDR